MSGNKSAFLLKKDLKNANLLSLEGSPNGMAAVSKTAGRKPLEVRLLYPPPKFGIRRNGQSGVAPSARVRERVRGAFVRFTAQSERTRQFRATTRSARAISRNQGSIQNTFELRSIHTASYKKPTVKWVSF